jgi:hypothetical protein
VGLQSQVEGAEYNLLADHCVFALQHKYDLVGQFFFTGDLMAREGSLLCLSFMSRSLEKRCRLTFANRRCSQLLSFRRGSRWKNARPRN